MPDPRRRLDLELVERGVAESPSQAQKLIMAGQVMVNGQVVTDGAYRIAEEVVLELVSPPRYVSRGGEKLEAALEHFALTDLSGWVCADVGASTGGFTDCLLKHQASRVYAIDVGYGLLHWKLRSDTRVVVMERTNARGVESLPEPLDLVTIDASFISLRVLLPVIRKWLKVGKGTVIALIKPQFEASKQAADLGKGVIRDPAVHLQVLEEVLDFAEGAGFTVRGVLGSPIVGPKGNREFLVWLGLQTPPSVFNWRKALPGLVTQPAP